MVNRYGMGFGVLLAALSAGRAQTAEINLERKIVALLYAQNPRGPVIFRGRDGRTIRCPRNGETQAPTSIVNDRRHLQGHRAEHPRHRGKRHLFTGHAGRYSQPRSRGFRALRELHVEPDHLSD